MNRLVSAFKDPVEFNLRSLFIAASFIFLPNIIFIAICHWLDVGRPYINIDYTFAMLLAVAGQRLLSGLIFVGLVFIDILAIGNQIFPLPRLTDVFYLLSVADLASEKFIYLIALVAVLIISITWASVMFAYRTNKTLVLFIFNIVITFYALHIYSNDYIGGFDRFYRVIDNALVSSQITDFNDKRDVPFLWRVTDEGSPLKPSIYKGATNDWHSATDLQSFDDKILLIVNESWGIPKNEAIQEAILKPLTQRWELEQGDLDFVGATVSAELRELCRLSQNNLNLANAVTGFEHCLPNNLKAAGYVTAAMHGAVSLMYDRKEWYPRAGLDERIFFETKVWPRRCYSFPGACDLDLMQEIPAFFSKSGKRFLYWLTLNSHSLYDKRDIKNDIFDCEAFKINKESESCRNLKLQAQFFAGLAEVLKAKEMQGIKVMIVGDHTPIIFNAQEKSANFVLNRVPWISFNTQK